MVLVSVKDRTSPTRTMVDYGGSAELSETTANCVEILKNESSAMGEK